ncbi:tetratricopeptide repeat protein [Sphingomonas sp.]|uniref:tetratricopeptide repeat protein n=1 Tax=Sphingomonas sp. TaxID=28214 RepID=UPI0017B987BC|nr:tetratricopeptide repeat protein [Sphingomonas sp.]MBA3510692.1 tetratricopeptide repeat protein [Sphingomonas sp.]
MIGAAALVAAPASARNPATDNPAWTYVQARAAAMSGDHRRSAELLAALAEMTADDTTINRKALAEAISAGNMPLALRLARRLPLAKLPVDGRMLLVADELKRGRSDLAIGLLSGPLADGSLSFFSPLLTAWNSAERRDLAGALAVLEKIPPSALLGPFRDENIAFILLKFRRAADAEPYALKALAAAGPRETRLRLALADGFLAAGDRKRALAMVREMGTETGVAKRRIEAGKRTGSTIDEPAKAYAELLLGMAVDLNRLDNRSLPIAMVQVARYADPGNAAGAVLLALLLDGRGRAAEALQVLDSVPASDPLAAQAQDTAARILIDEKRFDEAFRLARSQASASDATVSDLARLGDVYAGMKRYNEAADAYGRAVNLARAQGLQSELWPLYLLQASALEDADRWPETKQALHSAMALAPDQPLILNFLGYAKLERGEDLDAAEAMIRKASALAPDDASITDSLGWALYKRGRYADAIEALQRAAAKDPGQPEIHEHLGDALYASGRRYEARFAWNAALLTAEEDIAARVRAKLDTGLTPATAAP